MSLAPTRVGAARVRAALAESEAALEGMIVSTAAAAPALTESQTIVFRNGAHGGLSVIYRRPDDRLIWIVAALLIMPYLMGGDASMLLTVSPQFWGYFIGAIIGWYLGLWFGPKRARLNI